VIAVPITVGGAIATRTLQSKRSPRHSKTKTTKTKTKTKTKRKQRHTHRPYNQTSAAWFEAAPVLPMLQRHRLGRVIHFPQSRTRALHHTLQTPKGQAVLLFQRAQRRSAANRRTSTVLKISPQQASCLATELSSALWFRHHTWSIDVVKQRHRVTSSSSVSPFLPLEANKAWTMASPLRQIRHGWHNHDHAQATFPSAERARVSNGVHVSADGTRT
jgi:hypothetical protein